MISICDQILYLENEAEKSINTCKFFKNTFGEEETRLMCSPYETRIKIYQSIILSLKKLHHIENVVNDN